MKKTYLAAGMAALLLGACTTAQPYGPATSASAQGFTVQPIESDRYRVSYTALSPEEARSYVLRRAAEVTVENNADWFRIVGGYVDSDESSRPRSSLSIGGGSSSGRYGSGVGVGVGIGVPLGGSSQKTTESIEILIGRGPRPDTPEAYNARSVLENTPIR